MTTKLSEASSLLLRRALKLHGIVGDRIETTCPKHSDGGNLISMDIISSSSMLTVSCDACDKVFYVQAGWR